MTHSHDDMGRSIERAWHEHDRLAKEGGYGATPPGRALIQRMVQPLMELVIVERRDEGHPAYRAMVRRVDRRRVAQGLGAEARRQPREILDAISGIDHLNVATKILHVAVSVVYDPSLGRSRKSGRRNAARLIGHNLDQGSGPMAFRVGRWAIELLKELGFEERDGDLELPLIDGVGWDELMTDTTARNAFRSPYILPIHFSPEPWTGFRTGGLHHSKGWARPELIITKGKRSIEYEVRDAIRSRRLDPFLQAVNYLQGVAFRINEPVLRWTARHGLTTSGFTDMASFGNRKWWLGSEPHKEFLRQKAFGTAMREAEIIAKGGQFFSPLHGDNRGRLYGIPHFNFGREDYVRGLFMFEWGERIGDDGLIWLRAHLARLADGWRGAKTKHLNLDGRAAWTEAHKDELYAIAEAVERGEPIDNLPDEPIQFLAAALELKQANNNPDFVTHLPITFDCTCSGLQHLSAMTRCEAEGRLCNLIPSDIREDFYQVIADKTDEMRKVTKGPGVSFFYGSAPGCWSKDGDGDYHLSDGMIKEAIKSLREKGLSTKDVTRRVRAIYKIIGETVPQAKKAQTFLRRVAKVLFKHGKMLHWETPLGLPVLNFYYEPITEETKIKINRATKSATHIIGYDTEKPIPKAYTSAPANIVHSLDASHLHLVALAAARENIMMTAVHDSFGCLAPRARRFKQLIGEQFVELHKRDWLDEILQSAKRDLPPGTKLPKPPKRGELDISGVPTSFFAAS
jgi:DNA-directed RNA polymerase